MEASGTPSSRSAPASSSARALSRLCEGSERRRSVARSRPSAASTVPRSPCSSFACLKRCSSALFRSSIALISRRIASTGARWDSSQDCIRESSTSSADSVPSSPDVSRRRSSCASVPRRAARPPPRCAAHDSAPTPASTPPRFSRTMSPLLRLRPPPPAPPPAPPASRGSQASRNLTVSYSSASSLSTMAFSTVGTCCCVQL